MITCPNCGKRNVDKNKFCSECGTILPEPQNYCPKCDETFQKGEKFCTQCGNKLVNEQEYLQKLFRLRQEEERKRLKAKLKNLKNGYAYCNNCDREILESLDVCPFCDSKNILKKSVFKE